MIEFNWWWWWWGWRRWRSWRRHTGCSLVVVVAVDDVILLRVKSWGLRGWAGILEGRREARPRVNRFWDSRALRSISLWSNRTDTALCIFLSYTPSREHSMGVCACLALRFAGNKLRCLLCKATPTSRRYSLELSSLPQTDVSRVPWNTSDRAWWIAD
jgi:hypothetical protein